jgi:ABC-2 type transport system ATP-binding protein
MIEVTDLSKRYGDKLAVNRLSFRVQPGRVTGFRLIAEEGVVGA